MTLSPILLQEAVTLLDDHVLQQPWVAKARTDKHSQADRWFSLLTDIRKILESYHEYLGAQALGQAIGRGMTHEERVAAATSNAEIVESIPPKGTCMHKYYALVHALQSASFFEKLSLGDCFKPSISKANRQWNRDFRQDLLNGRGPSFRLSYCKVGSLLSRPPEYIWKVSNWTG